MFKRVSITVLLILFIAPAITFAGGSDPKCTTKYPVVLAHGMGASAEILGLINYWGSIDGALEDEGAEVYVTSVNGMDGTRSKANSFKAQFLEILAVSGADKVNIIGHSHGTIYTRDAITNLGLGEYVASHTSMAGPHKGSYIAVFVFDELRSEIADLLGVEMALVEDVVAGLVDFIYAFVFGDTDPDTAQNGWDLHPDYMNNVFNPNTENLDSIYYQSWAAKVKTFAPSIIMHPTWMIMRSGEGPNDGLVGIESAKWGNFKGVESGAWWSTGVDHLTIIGMPLDLTPGFDAPEFYIDIVGDLKSRGF